MPQLVHFCFLNSDSILKVHVSELIHDNNTRREGIRKCTYDLNFFLAISDFELPCIFTCINWASIKQKSPLYNMRTAYITQCIKYRNDKYYEVPDSMINSSIHQVNDIKIVNSQFVFYKNYKLFYLPNFFLLKNRKRSIKLFISFRNKYLILGII